MSHRDAAFAPLAPSELLVLCACGLEEQVECGCGLRTKLEICFAVCVRQPQNLRSNSSRMDVGHHQIFTVSGAGVKEQSIGSTTSTNGRAELDTGQRNSVRFARHSIQDDPIQDGTLNYVIAFYLHLKAVQGCWSDLLRGHESH